MVMERMYTEDRIIEVEEMFRPITNAKQTTIVEMPNNRLKMRIERKPFSAQELIE